MYESQFGRRLHVLLLLFLFHLNFALFHSLFNSFLSSFSVQLTFAIGRESCVCVCAFFIIDIFFLPAFECFGGFVGGCDYYIGVQKLLAFILHKVNNRHQF